MGTEHLWEKLRELDDAIGDQEDIVALSPGKDPYERLHDLQSQEKELLERIARTERDTAKVARAWYKLGLSSRGDAAQEAFREATEYEPENVYIWFNMGDRCNDEQRYDEAIAAYEQVLALLNTGRSLRCFGESLTRRERAFIGG